MKRFSTILLLPIVLLTLTSSTFAQANEKLIERAANAAKAFKQMMAAEDQSIPQDILDRSFCVAVFPSVKKAGFIFGGQFGRGLISCRKSGGSFGSPAYFTIGGGSFGLQIGGQAVDLVLLVINEAGMDGLLKDKFEIGAGAAGSIGPIGRNAHASTDILMNAKILSYSRSKGVFAGLELKGAVIKPDNDGNHMVYGNDVNAKDILIEGKVRTPKDIVIFPQTLRQFSAVKSK